MAPIAYSPKKEDLFFPCKNAQFFPAGVPASEAALCVEMARLAYCRSSPGFSFNRERIKNELSRVGFAAAGFFESSETSKKESTHCFLAVRNDQQLAVVSFRGTDIDDRRDLIVDADALLISWGKGGNVHEGFADAFEDVSQPLENALKSVTCRVLFTGHSLGAALATLLASIRPPTALYTAALYTFGSPLVGDADFVAILANTNNYRYVDCCDIVTRVPPEELGYRHVSKPYYIARDRSIHFDPARSVILKDRLAAFLEYPFKYQAWKKENVGLRGFADHAPVNYVTAVTASSGE